MEEELFFKFYEWAGAEKFAGIYALLDDPQSRWWDDITTVEIRETRDEVFLEAAQVRLTGRRPTPHAARSLVRGTGAVPRTTAGP